MKIEERITNAVNNIKTLLPDYWKSTIESRTPGTSNGSVFSFPNIEKVLFEDRLSDWVPFTECPNLLPGCTAFKMYNVQGHLGIVNLKDLDESVMLDVVNNKKTGMAKCLVSGAFGPETDEATLIIGEEQGREVVFTFHPGLPVRPDEIPIEKLKGRTKLSVSEAINIGFTHACIA